MIPAQNTRVAGYDFLVEHYQIADQSHWHHSKIAVSGGSKVLVIEGYKVNETFPAKFWPGDAPWDHLEFALKYDGLNLNILDLIFRLADKNELIGNIQNTPTGKYSRFVWFLYEFLRQETLPIPDAPRCNYAEILDPDQYYALKGVRIQRYRIIDNLLGPKEFCPIIRRTKALKEMEAENHSAQCQKILKSYSPELLHRAIGYLFQKETKSSFDIEKESPDKNRSDRFIVQLQLAEREDFCSKQRLIELQNRIVDTRYADSDYRTSQNYVGQTLGFQGEYIHYVCPRPQDIHSLMAGLIDANARMMKDSIHPVIHASIVAYGFVFLHPFEDGNGRIHRFLIHNVLALRGFTPSGMVFPVSASMHKYPEDYDKSLEAFSKPLMQQVQYHLDYEGIMVVHNDTGNLYRFADLTAQAEALSHFIALTIQEELTQELEFLRHYDLTRKRMRSIVDMPDRLLDLFMNLCIQSKGKLSVARRGSHFSKLTDEEITALENAVQEGFELKADAG